MDIKEIKQIVDLMKKSGLTEFAIEEENFKLQLKRGSENQDSPQVVAYAPPPPAAAAQAAAPAQSAAPALAAEAEVDNGKYITSPMVGTFYAAPSPENPAFVEAGQAVQEDTVVCIIEAMKIMNEIQAEQKGSIAEVLVENGQPVEYGQRLFRLA